ncbi:MAG: hypothetical protein JO041_07780 [Acidobacteria bacterium]|nr:hypothetical protein [Acidobacteriota bacterium]
MHRRLFSASLLILCALALFASRQGTKFPRSLSQEPTQQDERVRQEREKALNTRRQEDLKRDAGRLLEMASELKQDVDKTNENILSLDVIKKAEQIEKLAKSVKDKMKAQALEPAPSAEPRLERPPLF